MNKHLKIIICHNFSNFSYADTSKRLAIELSREGHDVIFYSHSTPDVLPEDKVKLNIKIWPEKRPTGYLSFKELYNTIKQQKTDILIAHNAALNIAGLAGKLLGVRKIIGYYHSSYESTLIDNNTNQLFLLFQRTRKRYLYRCFHQMICVSAFAAFDIQRWFGYPIRKTVIIHNALVDRFHTKVNQPKTDRNPVIFFSAGRLDPGKNIPKMADGFASFEQHHSGKVKLLIAGKGPQAKYIEQLSSNNPAIQYLGLIPYHQIDTYIQQSHVVVFSTLAEAFGMTIIEAMMNEKPVLASNIGGIPELVTNGEQGWLVNGNTAESWHKAFEEFYNLFTSSQTAYNTVCKNARMSFLKNYQQEQQLQKLIHLIHSIN